MRSVALALVSSLLLSPISVIAHYSRNHVQPSAPPYVPYYHSEDKEHGEHDESHYPQHSTQHSPQHSTQHSADLVESPYGKRIVSIALTVEYLRSDLQNICRQREESCLEDDECEGKKSCQKTPRRERETVCRKQRSACFDQYECQKKGKVCHLRSTNRIGFRCRDRFYNRKKIFSAARAACRKIIKNKQTGPFPATHTAFEFRKEGPYVEWPIKYFPRIFHRSQKQTSGPHCDDYGLHGSWGGDSS